MMELQWSIEGSFVTNFARERYKETNDLSIGVDFLCKAFIGFPKDLATAVVLGNKKLVGKDEVYVEDDSEEVVPYGAIKASFIKNVICGWLAPDGSVYGNINYNETNDHTALAERICERFELSMFNPEYTLEDLGYLKFSPSRILLGAKPATSVQKDIVAEYCLSHNLKVSLGFYGNTYSGSDIQQMDLPMFNKHLRAHD